MVSHDVEESFRIGDYVIYVGEGQGRRAGHGRSSCAESQDPLVHQFIRGVPDGPVHFHYPAPPLAEDLGVRA